MFVKFKKPSEEVIWTLFCVKAWILFQICVWTKAVGFQDKKKGLKNSVSHKFTTSFTKSRWGWASMVSPFALPSFLPLLRHWCVEIGWGVGWGEVRGVLKRRWYSWLTDVVVQHRTCCPAVTVLLTVSHFTTASWTSVRVWVSVWWRLRLSCLVCVGVRERESKLVVLNKALRTKAAIDVVDPLWNSNYLSVSDRNIIIQNWPHLFIFMWTLASFVIHKIHAILGNCLLVLQ